MDPRVPLAALFVDDGVEHALQLGPELPQFAEVHGGKPLDQRFPFCGQTHFDAAAVGGANFPLHELALREPIDQTDDAMVLEL